MKRSFIPALLGIWLAAGNQQKKETTTGVDTGKVNDAQSTILTVGNPKLLYTLPDKNNTPDELALGADPCIRRSL